MGNSGLTTPSPSEGGVGVGCYLWGDVMFLCKCSRITNPRDRVSRIIAVNKKETPFVKTHQFANLKYLKIFFFFDIEYVGCSLIYLMIVHFSDSDGFNLLRLNFLKSFV